MVHLDINAFFLSGRGAIACRVCKRSSDPMCAKQFAPSPVVSDTGCLAGGWSEHCPLRNRCNFGDAQILHLQ